MVEMLCSLMLRWELFAGGHVMQLDVKMGFVCCGDVMYLDVEIAAGCCL